MLGSAFSDSFQMIAFLLSVFNIVGMVSVSANDANANQNNNNNNRNDNSANGNEVNINEGNTNAEVNAMNTIMNLGRAVGQRLLDFWNQELPVGRMKRTAEVHDTSKQAR